MNSSQALFTFGTLMDTELLELVCEQAVHTLVLQPAHVADHGRRWVIDDHYPVLVPESGSRTQGVIIRGLSEAAMDRIVFFEGEEFSLREISVVSDSGESENVLYFADNHRKRISDSDWSLSDWQRSTKPDTMPRVQRYMQCYGKMSAADADAYW